MGAINRTVDELRLVTDVGVVIEKASPHRTTAKSIAMPTNRDDNILRKLMILTETSDFAVSDSDAFDKSD
jgi:hypothetical protein